jgi:hypothetical protein
MAATIAASSKRKGLDRTRVFLDERRNPLHRAAIDNSKEN